MKDLSKMSEQELEEYFEQEYQKILDQAPPSSKLKLQALQARMNGIKRRYKDPIARAGAMYGEMMKSFLQLNDALEGFRK